MTTRTDAVLPPLIIDRRKARSKGNEMTVVTPTAPRMVRKRISSWDPYEVWRTRVKSPNGSE
ncbi:MAG TPA: hypothetical protein VMU52_08205 [Steroidobacteraceae bacterium]|nr:hypothetical protein [Steroidobacteraceae bacterium]